MLDADALAAKLRRSEIRTLVDSIRHEDVVLQVLQGVGDTDSRGLRLVQSAMDVFERHCMLSLESALMVRFEKMDLGSDKSFSNLPKVV